MKVIDKGTEGGNVIVCNVYKRATKWKNRNENLIFGDCDDVDDVNDGIDSTGVIIEQYNTINIKLEQNWIRSSTRQAKNINCRFYYVTDRIIAGDVSITYKPTAEMCSHYHTKALTGSPFIKYRKTLMSTVPQKEMTLYENTKGVERKIKCVSICLSCESRKIDVSGNNDSTTHGKEECVEIINF